MGLTGQGVEFSKYYQSQQFVRIERTRITHWPVSVWYLSTNGYYFQSSYPYPLRTVHVNLCFFLFYWSYRELFEGIFGFFPCANNAIAIPFRRVSKLLNSLWYRLAPKSKVVASQEGEGDENGVEYNMDIDSWVSRLPNSIPMLVYPKFQNCGIVW